MDQRFNLRDTQSRVADVNISTQVPITATGDLPAQQTRIDVTRLGKWVDDSVQEMLRHRRDIEIDWQKVRLILNGIHYFDVDSLRGSVIPSIPDEDDDEVQAYTNLMLNAYRREYDDKRHCFKPGPLHDWASDGADSFRYAVRAINAGFCRAQALARPDSSQLNRAVI